MKQLVLTNSATEAMIQHPRLQHIGFLSNAKRKWHARVHPLRKSCCRHKKTRLTSQQRQHILNSVRQSVAIASGTVVQQIKSILNTDVIVVHLGVENGQLKTKTL